MSDTMNHEDYIRLTEAEEEQFVNQLKLGIFKELYRQDFLTRAQFNHLINIA